MKFLTSAPFLLFSAMLAVSLPASADNGGEVKIISRQIDRNLERVSANTEANRATFKNNFRPVKKNKSNRKFNEGPIFGDNDCSRPTCGGAIFGPQTCQKIKLPCDDCGDQPKPVKPRPHLKNYVTLEEDIFQTIHHRCGDFAPLQLEWVDFRIKKGRDKTYSRRLGNYRFRIFGCRRDQRHAILNEGRIIQKDMEFIRIFEDKVSDCYNIVKIPNDICLDNTKKPLPEYVLTAEITDYFMNLCDEYDWNDAKKANLRTGSAQMTVTWRLMDLSKSNVLWKGESNGYSEVPDGEYNAEMILIERAFADAVDNLRQLPGFEDRLAVRQTPQELETQKQALIAMERLNDPVKCQYQPEIKQAQTLCPVSETALVTEETAAQPQKETQMCTVQTPPELLSICPEDNPNCNGSIEELTTTIPQEKTFVVVDKTTGKIIETGGSNLFGKYAQDANVEISEQTTLTLPEQKTYVVVDKATGKIIETGGSNVFGKYAQNADVEIVEQTTLPASEEKTYVVVNKATGEVIESGGSEILGKYDQNANIQIIDKATGAIIELGGFTESGKYAQDYPETTVTVAEVGEVITIDGTDGETFEFVDISVTEPELSEREAEIADAAAKAPVRTFTFEENAETIDLAGNAESDGTPPDFCPLDEDGNPQCGAEAPVDIAVNTAETAYCEDGDFCEPSIFQTAANEAGDFCEPSAFGFLHEEDYSCSPSPFQFLHEENHDCEPSIFDKLFNTKPSCAKNAEQAIDIATFGVQETGGVIDLSGENQNWTPLAPEETQDAVSRNMLCVVNRGPYDKLTAENIYKVRASVVGVTNANGMKGAGLLISDQFVLTSADLIVKDNNHYKLKTINGVDLSGKAIRINLKKNTALILLDEKTQFTPLSLNLELPEIGTGGYMALGLLEDEEGGEGYLDNNGKVSGYRYSDNKGAEIIVDTFVQNVTVGGALIDRNGTINGMSHAGKKTEDGPDLFIPITTAINSVGLEICGQLKQAPKVPMAVIKPVSTAIDSFTGSKDPVPMGKKGRK